MSQAWGQKPKAKSWADNDDEKDGLPSFPGLHESVAATTTAKKPSDNDQLFPSLVEAAKIAPKKKKGQTISLAEFTKAGLNDSNNNDGVYRPSFNKHKQNRDEVDVFDLPKGPSRERRDEDFDQGQRRDGQLGGAFKEYGGDRGGGERGGRRDERDGDDRRGGDRYDDRRGGGDRYGGDRYDDRRGGGDRHGGDRDDRRGGGDRYGGDRDDNRRGGGDRYGGDRDDRRGGGDRYGGDRDDRRGGGDRYERRGGRDDRDEDREFDEDGRERRRSPGPSRADTGDWSKREVVPEREERRGGGGFSDRRGGGFEDREPRAEREPLGPSRADTGDWSTRASLEKGNRGGYELVKERPKLNLQKRSDDAEKTKIAAGASSSLFGGAKPVDVKYVEDKPREKVPEKDSSERRERREPREPRGGPRKDEELREATAEELAARPKLQLKKRETPVGESTATKTSSLFGGARPREEALKASGKDWKAEEDRLENARKAELKRFPDDGSNEKRRGFNFNDKKPSSKGAPPTKEEIELKNMIIALHEENDKEASEERSTKIDKLKAELKDLRVSLRKEKQSENTAGARKTSSSSAASNADNKQTKKQPQVADADGWFAATKKR